LRLRTERLLDRYQLLLQGIARAIVPDRRGRKNPRCVKIKMSKYPLKKSEYAA